MQGNPAATHGVEFVVSQRSDFMSYRRSAPFA
jgi:hypothetical protein